MGARFRSAASAFVRWRPLRPPHRAAEMRIRVLVADQSEARFYDLGPHNALKLVGSLADPLAHLHARHDCRNTARDRRRFREGLRRTAL